MEVGVGQAEAFVWVGVVEEVRVGFEDAGDEEVVIGADCSAEADGGVDPGVEELLVVTRVQNSGWGGARRC